ncbi:hypothetical protein AhyVDH1_058 [Aeromonas phage AhyVDH1]|nr:hypothetical protein AhyVDH1_058 [Aeromonas phage AhyVDH1]
MANHNQLIPVIATHIKTGRETLYPSITACADEGHFSRQYVMQCVHGTLKTHCGHTFRAAPGVAIRPELAPRAQEAARLRKEGKTIEEITVEMGVAADTVSKYLSWAKASGIELPVSREKESPRMQECLGHHFNGLTRSEIAAEMGVSAGTVKSHLMKAKSLGLISTISPIVLEEAEA